MYAAWVFNSEVQFIKTSPKSLIISKLYKKFIVDKPNFNKELIAIVSRTITKKTPWNLFNRHALNNFMNLHENKPWEINKMRLLKWRHTHQWIQNQAVWTKVNEKIKGPDRTLSRRLLISFLLLTWWTWCHCCTRGSFVWNCCRGNGISCTHGLKSRLLCKDSYLFFMSSPVTGPIWWCSLYSILQPNSSCGRPDANLNLLRVFHQILLY